MITGDHAHPTPTYSEPYFLLVRADQIGNHGYQIFVVLQVFDYPNTAIVKITMATKYYLKLNRECLLNPTCCHVDPFHNYGCIDSLYPTSSIMKYLVLQLP